MTRYPGNLASARGPGKLSLLRPIRPARNLTAEVVDRIAAEIGSGRIPPGSRLPTEQALVAALGVSRTVVREAVAALRAEGLVVTRQGAGAFVAADRSRVPFRIDPDRLSSIDDVLRVMELRAAIEIQAATLAAERVTRAGLLRIEEALAALESAIGRGEAAVSEDFALHRSIALATDNPRFAEFLEFLGRHVIPRQSIRVSLNTTAEQRRYLARIQREHRRICAAIRARDPAGARQAMRTHLTRSLERYRRLAERQSAARRPPAGKRAEADPSSTARDRTPSRSPARPAGSNPVKAR
jgi:GntR family transcriptional regulator, transcriptional repressor for pyruvate dehydrogenase complex